MLFELIYQSIYIRIQERKIKQHVPRRYVCQLGNPVRHNGRVCIMVIVMKRENWFLLDSVKSLHHNKNKKKGKEK